MPESEQMTFEQRIILTLENQVKGPDVSRILKATEKELQRTNKLLSKVSKSWDRYSKAIKGVSTHSDKLTKAQGKTQAAIRKTNTALRNQSRQAGKTERAFSRLGGTLTRIGGLLGVGALGYAAVRRIQDTFSKRFSLALVGGHEQIGLIRQLTDDKYANFAIDFAARFQAQSPYARFVLGKDAIQGLIQAQRALAPIGYDRATQVLLDVTKSLEPQRLQAFVKTAQTGDVERALLRSANQGNIMQVTSALNALALSKDYEQDREKVDPMMQAAIAYQKASDALASKFDQAVDKFAAAIAGYSPTELIGGAVAAYLGLKGAGALGRYGVGKLVSRGIGRGIGGGAIPVTVTRVAPGFATGAARALPAAGTGLLPGAVGGATLAKYAPVASKGLLARAAAIPSLAIGTFVAGMASLADSIYATAKGQRAYGPLGRAGQYVNRSTREGLAYKDTLDRNAAFIAKKIAEQNFSPEEKKMFDEGKIDQLRAVKGLDPTVNKLKSVLKTVTDGIDLFDKKIREMSKKALQQRLEQLQQQAARQQQLVMSATEQSSLTALARERLALAKIAPLGMSPFLGMSQMNDLLGQIGKEIAGLQKVLSNIDQSTHAGRIESNMIRSAINRLRIENKSLRLAQIEALVNGVIGSAMGSIGRFERIIVTGQKNVAIALEKNMISPPKGFSGLFGLTGEAARKNFRRPIDARKIYGDIPGVTTRRLKPFPTHRQGSGADDVMEALGTYFQGAMRLMASEHRRDLAGVANAPTETPRSGSASGSNALL